MKICENGDSLWSNYYSHYGGDTTHDYHSDLFATSDDGFIMTGYLINNYKPARNDILVIKTDSVGCITGGCFPGSNTCPNNKEWAPIGAKWHYTKYNAINTDESFTLYHSKADTTVKNRDCRLFNTGDIMYEIAGRVWHYHAGKDSFYLLYNFGAGSGESWDMLTVDPYDDSSLLTVFIDSIGDTTINGKLLRTQYISVTDPNWSFDGKIIEGIGWNGFMFPYRNIMPQTWPGPLRCYEDLDLGLYETGFAESCEFVTGINETATSPKLEIRFLPNPFSNLGPSQRCIESSTVFH